MPTASATALPRRLREGLERIAAVLRSEQWAAATALGLTPTQLHILLFLAGRGEQAAGVSEIAGQLGVSQPTATDSAAALQRKGLVQKAEGRRGLLINPSGRDAVAATGLAANASEAALADLAPADQQALLLLIVKLIRGLQESGAIVPQRLCVTCRHFRPMTHPGQPKPHHCAFVNAAFGTDDLRLDCREHEPADPASQAATWQAFTHGSAIPQAST